MLRSQVPAWWRRGLCLAFLEPEYSCHEGSDSLSQSSNIGCSSVPITNYDEEGVNTPIVIQVASFTYGSPTSWTCGQVNIGLVSVGVLL